MNIMLKKTITSFIAISSLALCTFANTANAASNTEPFPTDSSISDDSGTRGYWSGTLYDTAQHFVEKVKGPTTVNVYANFSSTVEIDYYFNGVYQGCFTFSYGSPSHQVTVPSNTYCDFYIQSYYASYSNPNSGYVNIY